MSHFNTWFDRVQTFRITIHDDGQFGNALECENHTTEYLLLPDGNSPQINMRTEPEYIDEFYEIRPRDYHPGQSGIIRSDYPVVNPFAPRDVDGLLRQAYHDAYTFTKGQIGCKYRKYVQIQHCCCVLRSLPIWCSMLVVYMLEKHSCVAQGSVVDLHARSPFPFSVLRPQELGPYCKEPLLSHRHKV